MVIKIDIMKVMNIIVFLLIANFSTGQEFLNLDFEHEVLDSHLPKKWYLAGRGYKISIEEHEVIHGNKSLRIESSTANRGQFGIFSNSLPINYAINKTIELKGKVKTYAVQEGSAKIWCRVNTNDTSILGSDTLSNKELVGDNDWTEFSIIMEVQGDVREVLFGGLLSGTGIALFDDFEVFIDGIKFKDVEPEIIIPSKEQLAWLRKHIYPLKSFDPKFGNDEDLEIFSQLVGESKIVAFGESAHGSSEIFQMKHRLIKYLTQNKDFNIFSIEANMPESYKINDYVFEGKGYVKSLIEGMHFWTWRTEEVLQMVEWMKVQNKTNKNIHFTGFDMQIIDESINILATTFENQAHLINEINTLKLTLTAVNGTEKTFESQILAKYDKEVTSKIFSTLKAAIQSESNPKLDKEWLLRNLRILEQFIVNNETFYSRDKFMAENIEWIYNQNPHSKIAVWAHNGHIKKTDDSMGAYLAQSFNEDYIAVGFTFNEGQYTALGRKGLDTYPAQRSYPGTFEYIFNALEEPIFLLDLRKIRSDDSNDGLWFKKMLEFRNVGAVKVLNEFQPTNIFEDFDMLVFINESTNSKLLD